MKEIFAFETKEEYEKHASLIERFNLKLKVYQQILEKDFELNDLPKGIVWTSEELATTVFSTLPIPAFTNKDLIYFSPDLSAWKKLFIKQLEGRQHPEIERFYENLSENQLFTIVGHELTHHLDLFVDEFDDDRADGIWFEKGMCDYLSLSTRRLHLISIFKSGGDELSSADRQKVCSFLLSNGIISSRLCEIITSFLIAEMNFFEVK